MTVTPDWITVVSGVPRSGTSMMMSVLEAGGLEPLKDDIRAADEDNPRGYYELELVKIQDAKPPAGFHFGPSPEGQEDDE